MPRKVAQPAPQPETDESGQQKVCYLDNFLESAPANHRIAPASGQIGRSPHCAGVTETANLPAEIKRSLAHLRDLDTQAQEQYADWYTPTRDQNFDHEK